MRTNKEIEKMKLQKEYKKLGVEVNPKYKSGILIPRALRKDQLKIMNIFDAHFSNLYGEDPEEEKRKQELLADGVYIYTPEQKSPSHIFMKNLMVPVKYEESNVDKKNVFEKELRELFKIHKIKYF